MKVADYAQSEWKLCIMFSKYGFIREATSHYTTLVIYYKILTNLEELSFLTVLAFPKAKKLEQCWKHFNYLF